MKMFGNVMIDACPAGTSARHARTDGSDGTQALLQPLPKLLFGGSWMNQGLLLRALDDFRSWPYRSREELRDLQFARLRSQVTHAWENVPFYRKLFDGVGFHPRDLRSLKDLEAMPVTTRSALKSSRPEDLIARGYTLQRLLTTRSAGSTGVPLTAYRTPAESRVRNLLMLRPWLHHGMGPTDRVLTISGRPSTVDRNRWLRRLPMAWRWNLNVLDDEETMIRALRDFQPAVIYGYSYHVARLASLARERRIRVSKPRIVATSGDLLLPHFRTIIREVWGAEAIDIYSASELGDMAWQCRRREALHINADQFVFEFVRDGRGVEDGEQGEILVTHLYRRSMPLIRYSPGDLGVPTSTRCNCGVTFPLMKSLEGRMLDAVRLPGGRIFVNFNRLMMGEPQLLAYQVLQTAPDDFTINLVLPVGSDVPSITARVEQQLRHHLGESARVEAHAVSEPELIRRGNKVPAVIPFAPVDLGNA